MNQESEWGEVYSAACYVVFADGREIYFEAAKANKDLAKLLVNQSVSRWAFVTAHNPRSTLLSAAENSSRQKKLIAEVSASGWRYISGVARAAPGTNWPEEDSLLVLDIELAEALTLAAAYEQNAILFGQADGFCELHWVNGG